VRFLIAAPFRYFLAHSSTAVPGWRRAQPARKRTVYWVPFSPYYLGLVGAASGLREGTGRQPTHGAMSCSWLANGNRKRHWGQPFRRCNIGLWGRPQRQNRGAVHKSA